MSLKCAISTLLGQRAGLQRGLRLPAGRRPAPGPAAHRRRAPRCSAAAARRCCAGTGCVLAGRLARTSIAADIARSVICRTRACGIGAETRTGSSICGKNCRTISGCIVASMTTVGAVQLAWMSCARPWRRPARRPRQRRCRSSSQGDRRLAPSSVCCQQIPEPGQAGDPLIVLRDLAALGRVPLPRHARQYVVELELAPPFERCALRRSSAVKPGVGSACRGAPAVPAAPRGRMHARREISVRSASCRTRSGRNGAVAVSSRQIER